MTERFRGCAAAALVLLLCAAGAARAGDIPALDHVFVIIGENMRFEDVTQDRASEAPYLNGLAHEHVRHAAFYGVAHASLGNYLALVSGQRPTWLDRRNCPSYAPCVRTGPTIAAQLDRRGLTWRGYFESMPHVCARPKGFFDEYYVGYATRHDPFVYFSEIVRNAAYCNAHVVPFEKFFAADLQGSAPSFALIVPNTCNDGHDAGCQANRTPLEVFDDWLAHQVPPILEFMATHPRSALFVTFDESDSGDLSSCCNQARTAGGGHIDLVMVAPGLERGPGHRVTEPGNHYSLLRTLEEAFGLPALGEAKDVSPMRALFVPEG